MALDTTKNVEPLGATATVESTMPVRRVRDAQKAGLEERFSDSDARTDLTRVPVIGPPLSRILKSRKFQFYIILPSQVLFWLVVISGIFGTLEPTQNFATAITWYIWFALVFPLTLLVGRAWCATCPFGGVGEWIQRKTFWKRTQKSLGLGWKLPQSLAGYGLIISAVLFIGMTWMEEFLNIAGPGTPSLTSYMILGIIGSSVLVSLLFERRTFCRYFCPLSSLIGTAGCTGMVAGFRPRDREMCLNCATKECMRGGKDGFGCPWYTYPATADTNTYCGLCSECYKACPYENVGVYVQKPLTSVVAPKKRPELAWAVALLFGLVIFQQWNALVAYSTLDGWLNGMTHFPNYPNPIDYVLSIGAVVGILAGVAFLISRLISFRTKVARRFTNWFAPLMYGLIPLMGADYLARVMPKFFNNAARFPAAVLGIFGKQAAFADAHILSDAWVLRAQYIAVGLGTMAAMYATSKIAGKDLKALTPHPLLAKLIPSLVMLVIGVGMTALYVAMKGAE